jgi:AcrR family transcriptional regulator
MSKRLTAEQRKKSILATAKQLFAKNGFYGVSIDEIVHNEGVSPAVLYKHFTSKEQLYNAVMEELSGQREDYVKIVVNEDNGFVNMLKSMTLIFTNSILKQPDLLKMELHNLLGGSDQNKTNSDFFNNRWKSFYDFIEDHITSEQKEGNLENVNPKAACIMFQGMIRELLLTQCCAPQPPLNKTEFSVLLDDLISLFITLLQQQKR